jgi:hypothetical protein
MAFLVGASEKLVRDYLVLYERVQGQPHQAAKLAEEIERVRGLNPAAEKGGRSG